jgi:hypothetical protein
MFASATEDFAVGEIHIAGERVPAGTYKRVDTGRTVRLIHEDSLPASLDGRVACYVRVAGTWAQLEKQAA